MLTERKGNKASSIEYELGLRVPPLGNEVVRSNEALTC